jgi:hypothetical protein
MQTLGCAVLRCGLTSASSPDALTKPTNRLGSRWRQANGPQVPAVSMQEYHQDLR